MTIHCISPNGNDSTGLGTPSRPWRSYAKVNPLLRPGDGVEAADGLYFDAPAPVNSGTEEAPITYYAAGDAAVVRSRATLSARSHIKLQGLNFLSRYWSWLVTDDNSSHYSIEDCTFDSEIQTQEFTFIGMMIRGLRPKFVRNKIRTWAGGDAIQWWASHGLLADLDASQVRSAHGVLMLYNGSYNIFTGNNPLTNPWGRAGTCLRTGADGCVRNLIEGLHVSESGWDGAEATPGSTHHSGTGDQQQIQIGGLGTILRRSSFRNNEIGGAVAHSYYSTIQVAGRGSSTGVVDEFSYLRVYGNEAHGNPIPFFSLTHANDAALMHAEDVRVQFNNVSDPVATYIRTGPWQETLRINNNDQALVNWPVTVENVVGDVVTVSDAWGLHPGDAHWGIAGDALTVYGQTVRVTEWIDGRTVRVSPTPVREQPPIVVVPVPEPEPEPEPQPTPEPLQVTLSIRVVLDVNGQVVELTTNTPDT